MVAELYLSKQDFKQKNRNAHKSLMITFGTSFEKFLYLKFFKYFPQLSLLLYLYGPTPTYTALHLPLLPYTFPYCPTPSPTALHLRLLPYTFPYCPTLSPTPTALLLTNRSCPTLTATALPLHPQPPPFPIPHYPSTLTPTFHTSSALECL